MAGRDTLMPEGNATSQDVRLATLRAVLQRDVADVDATEVLTALVDALDGYQRKPLRIPTPG